MSLMNTTIPTWLATQGGIKRLLQFLLLVGGQACLLMLQSGVEPILNVRETKLATVRLLVISGHCPYLHTRGSPFPWI